MALTITLQPEFEARFTKEAHRVGLSVEQLVVQRAMEAEGRNAFGDGTGAPANPA